MSITGSNDIGNGRVIVTVDHDPTTTTTDVLKGSLIVETGTARVYVKLDDGATTNVSLSSTGAYQRYSIFADQMENPINSNWAVNALAPASADTVNAALTVRRFDDTTEEGAGFTVYLPPNSTTIKFTFSARGQTAPAATRTVGLKLYYKQIPNNSAVGSWNNEILTDFSIPNNANFQTESQTLAFTDFSPALVADNTYALELTRINPTAGTELVGDWDLHHFIIEVS